MKVYYSCFNLEGGEKTSFQKIQIKESLEDMISFFQEVVDHPLSIKNEAIYTLVETSRNQSLKLIGTFIDAPFLFYSDEFSETLFTIPNLMVDLSESELSFFHKNNKDLNLVSIDLLILLREFILDSRKKLLLN